MSLTDAAASRFLLLSPLPITWMENASAWQSQCDNIPMWISLCCDSAFAHKKEFIFLNIRKVFGDLFRRSHNSIAL